MPETRDPDPYAALEAAEAALIDLGACPDENCREWNCNHALAKVRAALKAREGAPRLTADEREKMTPEENRERLARLAATPYENTLTLEELRAEVRRCWDLEQDITEALRDMPQMPSRRALLFLGYAAKYPEDTAEGKRLQRELGSGVIPYKSECEGGAGLWFRLRRAAMKEAAP